MSISENNIQLAKSGDEQAFIRLYMPHSKKIRYCSRIVFQCRVDIAKEMFTRLKNKIDEKRGTTK